MKTISIQDRLMTRFNDTRVMMSGAGNMAVDFPQLPGPRARVPQWLPAPPLSRAAPAEKSDTRKAAKGIWIPLARESVAEKLMIGLLVAGAAIGIAYGFSCLLDLVQGWAGVSLGISNLVQ
jgi:hypothetical protein